jgi:single-strand DNA-binding protein
MSDINNVFLTGRLGNDAELKFTPSGTAIIDFRIAVNDYQGKDKDEYTNWLECVVFGKEKIVNYLKKGTKVMIEGRIKQERWDKDGKTQSRVKVIINQIQFQSKKEGAESTNGGYNAEDEIPF